MARYVQPSRRQRRARCWRDSVSHSSTIAGNNSSTRTVQKTVVVMAVNSGVVVSAVRLPHHTAAVAQLQQLKPSC